MSKSNLEKKGFILAYGSRGIDFIISGKCDIRQGKPSDRNRKLDDHIFTLTQEGGRRRRPRRRPRRRKADKTTNLQSQPPVIPVMHFLQQGSTS